MRRRWLPAVDLLDKCRDRHARRRQSAPHRRPAGRPGESLVQPEWAASGELFVVSDFSNRSNVYRVGAVDELVPAHPVAAEVGEPAWIFGQSTYLVADDGTVWFTYSRDGHPRLVSVAPDGSSIHRGTPYLRMDHVAWDCGLIVATAAPAMAVVTGATSTAPRGTVEVDDTCAAATLLAEQGWVDGARPAIRGGSAGSPCSPLWRIATSSAQEPAIAVSGSVRAGPGQPQVRVALSGPARRPARSQGHARVTDTVQQGRVIGQWPEPQPPDDRPTCPHVGHRDRDAAQQRTQSHVFPLDVQPTSHSGSISISRPTQSVQVCPSAQCSKHR